MLYIPKEKKKKRKQNSSIRVIQICNVLIDDASMISGLNCLRRCQMSLVNPENEE